MLLQTLHGVTFGAWYLSVVRFIQDRAPERLRTSLQALAMSAIGLGMTAGFLLGGWLFGARGAPYGIAAVLALVALTFYVASMGRAAVSGGEELAPRQR